MANRALLHRPTLSDIGALVFGLCVGLVATEVGVRLADLKPRVTVIGPRNLRWLDGVPVWEDPSDRTNRGCVEQHPQRTRVLFIGSSVTFGYALRPDEAFTAALQARLNERRPTPGFCVLNFAQPAFFFDQKYAVARVEAPRYAPQLILWENWLDWFAYSPMGSQLYESTRLALRPDGFAGVDGVPDGVNRFLFVHSRAYEYLALTVGERRRSVGEQAELTAFLDRLSDVPRLAQSVGTKLVMYVASPLNAPFSEIAASPPSWQRAVTDFARARGIPLYSLARELRNEDYLQLRMDECCHFNARGHQALVPIMERIILEQLDGHPVAP